MSASADGMRLKEPRRDQVLVALHDLLAAGISSRRCRRRRRSRRHHLLLNLHNHPLPLPLPPPLTPNNRIHHLPNTPRRLGLIQMQLLLHSIPKARLLHHHTPFSPPPIISNPSSRTPRPPQLIPLLLLSPSPPTTSTTPRNSRSVMNTPHDRSLPNSRSRRRLLKPVKQPKKPSRWRS